MSALIGFKVDIPILENILKNNSNCVVAMCPSGLKDYYYHIIKKYNPIVVCISDTAENILKRLNFYDEHSRFLNITLSEREKKLYLREIKKDITYYKNPLINDLVSCNKILSATSIALSRSTSFLFPILSISAFASKKNSEEVE